VLTFSDRRLLSPLSSPIYRQVSPMTYLKAGVYLPIQRQLSVITNSNAGVCALQRFSLFTGRCSVPTYLNAVMSIYKFQFPRTPPLPPIHFVFLLLHPCEQCSALSIHRQVNTSSNNRPVSMSHFFAYSLLSVSDVQS